MSLSTPPVTTFLRGRPKTAEWSESLPSAASHSVKSDTTQRWWTGLTWSRESYARRAWASKWLGCGHNRPAETGALAALSPREYEVLGLMAEGLNNAAVARRLWLTGKTVETHVRSILTKLNLSTSDDGHRRVMAVLAYLKAPMSSTPTP